MNSLRRSTYKALHQLAFTRAKSSQAAAVDVFAHASSWDDITLESKPWTSDSKRTGVLAMKVGMMPVFDEWGDRHACTVLQVEECQVVGVKTEDKHGYNALQLGAGIRKERNVTKPVKGQFEKAGVPVKRTLQEFRVTPDALLPPGQMVDVCGTSIGKGFQGVMKLHNFKGQQASHGNSKAHRLPGSTGQCQDPGRVFKGKKMPGRMGGKRVTRDNLWVVKIDPARNLLYVKGSVPGNKGGMIRVTDARKKQFDEAPAFPTYIPTEGEDMSVRMAPKAAVDPFLLP